MLPALDTEFDTLLDAKIAILESCVEDGLQMGTTQSMKDTRLEMRCSLREKVAEEPCTYRIKVSRVMEISDPFIFKVTELVSNHSCSKSERKDRQEKARVTMRNRLEVARKGPDVGAGRPRPRQIVEDSASSVLQGLSYSYDSEEDDKRDRRAKKKGERHRKKRLRRQGDCVGSEAEEDDEETSDGSDSSEGSSDEELDTGVDRRGQEDSRRSNEEFYPSAAAVKSEVDKLLQSHHHLAIPSPAEKFDRPRNLLTRCYAFAIQNGFTVYQRLRDPSQQSIHLVCNRSHQRYVYTLEGKCPFSIRAKRNDDDTWSVSTVSAQHCHKLSPLKLSSTSTSRPPVASNVSQTAASGPSSAQMRPPPPPSRISNSAPVLKSPAVATDPSNSLSELVAFLRAVDPSNPYHHFIASKLIANGITSLELLRTFLGLEERMYRLIEADFEREGLTKEVLGGVSFSALAIEARRPLRRFPV